ncbi:cell division protein FtsA [Aurantiacibacter zhengii]|uniref:Cell division protein FtsA n=1 Tax=Aurantiacibacter zhengii TaxID=2307003 RepID=A0A418NRY8_9SPHN|nr:cell division protein FtsA [Aurantiacibacter zhengii]RIV85826.1 cell division protein FtsA [Aurantiacibacter zhengii]
MLAMQVDVVRSWWRTRRAMRMSAGGLAAHRERQWRELQSSLARTPAIAQYPGKLLCEYPITEICDLRTDYGLWNSLGLTDADLREMADVAERGEDTGDIVAGWSTGSGGGTRGLFVANARERADYLGQSLARLLPPAALFRRQRIALHLRAGSALYSDVESGRMAFRHVSLDQSSAEALGEIEAYAPTVLIAPPHRLIDFARQGADLPSLRHLFTGSEAISAAETDFVTNVLGLRPRSIWQATEGFLGAECAGGRLHLNDHALAIELEPVCGTSAFRPIITDLRRRSQPVVRLRGDDLVELADDGPCACGYAGRVIRPIAGRAGDLWRLGDITLTPRQVVEAVENVLGARWNWQACASPHEAILRVTPDAPAEDAARAQQALARLAPVHVRVEHTLPAWTGPKRRKVVWTHPST